jgi:tRNA C32,U32 (ribose-2'-O)-methylase TrmJ
MGSIFRHAVGFSSLAGDSHRLRLTWVSLLIGHEGSGLSCEAESVADMRVRIPMTPGTDSLNMATAAASALYALSQPIDKSRYPAETGDNPAPTLGDIRG